MSQLSDKVLLVCTPYLGPAAKVFLKRQCARLDGLDLEALEKKHLPDLARWIGISAALVIDKEKAKELALIVKLL
jgi:hypothetical protein